MDFFQGIAKMRQKCSRRRCFGRQSPDESRRRLRKRLESVVELQDGVVEGQMAKKLTRLDHRGPGTRQGRGGYCIRKGTEPCKWVQNLAPGFDTPARGRRIVEDSMRRITAAPG